MSFNTGNPLPSKDILDLYDNSENIDHFANSQEEEHPDRFGAKRLTLAGLIKRSMVLRNEINDFSGALTFKPEWSDVPMNVSEGVGGEGGALNLQAEALGNRSEINRLHTREAIRRTYAECNLNLVPGSFEEGATVFNMSDVVLENNTGKVFRWTGEYPKSIIPGENTLSGENTLTNWKDVSDLSFLNEVVNIKTLDQTDLRIAIQQTLDNGVRNIYIPNGDFNINNNEEPIKITNDDVKIFGTGNLKFSRYDNSGIYVTGKRCKLLNFGVEGPGGVNPVYQGESGGLLNAFCPGLISLVGVTAIDEPAELETIIDGVRISNPGIKGISAYKALDFKITNCIVRSDYPIENLFGKPQFFGIGVYTCARFEVSFNTTFGCSQGISIGALGVGYQFDDKLGSNRAHTVRHFTVIGNRTFKCNDHGIYVSNDASNYLISSNYLWPASSAEKGAGGGGLKLEGGDFSAIGNVCRDGVVLRNVYNCDISSNYIPIYSPIGAIGNGDVKWGIMHEETVFKRPAKNISITNNVLCVVGDVSTTGAIQFTGRVWDGYQSLISNLKISGNVATGFGKETQTQPGLGVGYGIYVIQQLLEESGRIIDIPAKNISITNNSIKLAAGARLGSYGIMLGNAIDEAVVTDNNLSGMTKQAVRLLGVRKSIFQGNSVSSLVGVEISDFAFEERVDNSLSIHVISQQNVYGENRIDTNYPAKYFLANETSRITDGSNMVTNLGGKTSVLLQAYEVSKNIYSNSINPVTITLGSIMVWPIGMEFSIINAGSSTMTINRPVGTPVTIPQDSSRSFLSIGGNAMAVF